MFLWLTTLLSFILSIGAMAAANRFLDVRIPLLGSFAGLERSFNPGIAFSFRFPASIQLPIILAALACVIFLAHCAPRGRLHDIAFGLVIGGALGNLADRMLDGVVTDYVQAGTFPVFNAADICITIGVGLLLIGMLKKSSRNRWQDGSGGVQ